MQIVHSYRDKSGKNKRKVIQSLGYLDELEKQYSDPIAQMRLAVDKQGIPISYRLFEGNTHDSQTLMPALKDIKNSFRQSELL